MKSVRILLAHAIDYAGLFPPAGLAMEAAVRNFKAYREGADSWALGRFVVPRARAEEAGLPSDAMSVVAGGAETSGAMVYLERPMELLGDVQRLGSACAVMHGFLNVLLAASLAWHGGLQAQVRATLEESDATALRFDDAGVAWHGHQLSNAQVTAARTQFIVSFGSCSFEEPMAELRNLQLL